MCGPDIPRPSLGGALAVLTPTSLSTSNSNSSSTASSPPSTPGSSRASSPAGGPAWSGGSLVFHGPQRVGGVATHATFTPSPSQSADVGADMADYVVGIHATGDLQRPALESPILHRIGFRGASSPDFDSDSQSQSQIRVPLATPLELGVGGDGIIGRRVTLWRTNGGGVVAMGGAGDLAEYPVAEGIVGFN